jgi:hypothetical protein
MPIMPPVRRLSSLVFVLGLGLGLSALVKADPLPLRLMPNSTLDDVKSEAAYEAINGPVWGNSPDPTTLPFHATLTGTVTADATTAKLAIFSDDGCDVLVDGVKVWSTKDQPQALPDLPSSLHELPVTLTAGTHTVEIDYSNVIYYVADPTTGQPVDIDGCTLFQYGHASPYTVTVTSGLTGNAARACAGAVADGVHEDALTLHVAQADGTAAAGLPLTLAYDKSVDYTNCQAPQFIDDQNQNKAVPTLARTTDGSGNVTLTVLSSDLISKPNVLVSNNGTQIGNVGCDFAADQSLRRYGILTYDPGEGYGTDTGWDFDSYALENPGDTADAKVFLRFQKDPSVPMDQNYYLVNGQAVPSLDVDGDGDISQDEYNAGAVRGDASHLLNDSVNWLPVSGHTAHLRISQITDYVTGATITDPATIQQYVYYVDGSGQPLLDPNTTAMPTFVSAMTGGDGSAVIHLKAGPQISSLGDVTMDVVDESEIASGGTGSF